MTKLKTLPVSVWAVLALFFSATGCGKEDSIFTGLSGVILFIIVVWFLFFRNRD